MYDSWETQLNLRPKELYSSTVAVDKIEHN